MTDTGRGTQLYFYLPEPVGITKCYSVDAAMYGNRGYQNSSRPLGSTIILVLMPSTFGFYTSQKLNSLGKSEAAFVLGCISPFINGIGTLQSHPHHDWCRGFWPVPRVHWVCAQHPPTQYASGSSPLLSAQHVCGPGRARVCAGSTGVHINHSAGHWHRHTVPLSSHHAGLPFLGQKGECFSTLMAVFSSKRTDICGVFNSSWSPRSFVFFMS